MSFSNILHKLALSKIPLTFIFQVFCENYLLIRIAKLNMGNLIIMKKRGKNRQITGGNIGKMYESSPDLCRGTHRTHASQTPVLCDVEIWHPY